MCALLCHNYLEQAIEDDERELREINVVNLHKYLLSNAWVRCCLFLFIEGIQFAITIEVKVRWCLVTC